MGEPAIQPLNTLSTWRRVRRVCSERRLCEKFLRELSVGLRGNVTLYLRYCAAE